MQTLVVYRESLELEVSSTDSNKGLLSMYQFYKKCAWKLNRFEQKWAILIIVIMKYLMLP